MIDSGASKSSKAARQTLWLRSALLACYVAALSVDPQSPLLGRLRNAQELLSASCNQISHWRLEAAHSAAV